MKSMTYNALSIRKRDSWSPCPVETNALMPLLTIHEGVLLRSRIASLSRPTSVATLPGTASLDRCLCSGAPLCATLVRVVVSAVRCRYPRARAQYDKRVLRGRRRRPLRVRACSRDLHGIPGATGGSVGAMQSSVIEWGLSPQEHAVFFQGTITLSTRKASPTAPASPAHLVV